MKMTNEQQQVYAEWMQSRNQTVPPHPMLALIVKQAVADICDGKQPQFHLYTPQVYDAAKAAYEATTK
jgi:hypothetical protein